MHSSSNRARRRATTLIETSALPLSEAATSTAKTLVKANFSYYTELTENQWNLACHYAADFASFGFALTFIFAFYLGLLVNDQVNKLIQASSAVDNVHDIFFSLV